MSPDKYPRINDKTEAKNMVMPSSNLLKCTMGIGGRYVTIVSKVI